MLWKAGILSVALSVCAGGVAYAQESPDLLDPADQTIVRGCHYGEFIDSSTPEQAKARLETAGYAGVTILRKGCDNVWHAFATYNGRPTNIMLIPNGEIKPYRE